MRHGYTLLELALVLTIMTALCALAAPTLLHGRAILAVRGARAELLSAIATTRAQAILVGGAQLVIEPAGTVRRERSDGMPVGEVIDLAARYGVIIDTARNQPVTLRYDGLGIGRLANTTLQLRRGQAVASIVVSAYGRARP